MSDSIPRKRANKNARLLTASLFSSALSRHHGWVLYEHPLQSHFSGQVKWARAHGLPELVSERIRELLIPLFNGELVQWGTLSIVYLTKVEFTFCARIGARHHPCPIWLVSNICTSLDL
jgi:hypothetical protein